HRQTEPGEPPGARPTANDLGGGGAHRAARRTCDGVGVRHPAVSSDRHREVGLGARAVEGRELHAFHHATDAVGQRRSGLAVDLDEADAPGAEDLEPHVGAAAALRAQAARELAAVALDHRVDLGVAQPLVATAFRRVAEVDRVVPAALGAGLAAAGAALAAA